MLDLLREIGIDVDLMNTKVPIKRLVAAELQIKQALEEYVRIKSLTTAEHWAYYEQNGINDLAEVKLLKKAKSKVKAIIRNRFGHYMKEAKQDEKDDASASS